MTVLHSYCVLCLGVDCYHRNVCKLEVTYFLWDCAQGITHFRRKVAILRSFSPNHFVCQPFYRLSKSRPEGFLSVFVVHVANVSSYRLALHFSLRVHVDLSNCTGSACTAHFFKKAIPLMFLLRMSLTRPERKTLQCDVLSIISSVPAEVRVKTKRKKSDFSLMMSNNLFVYTPRSSV